MVLSALILSIAANLDTLLIALAYGMAHIRLSPIHCLIIAGITTTGTCLSIWLGSLLSSFMPAFLPGLLGGLLLAGMGCYFIITQFTKHSETVKIQRIVPLAFALTINNTGIGIAAGIAHTPWWIVGLFTFFLTLLFVYLGTYAGKTFLSRITGKYSSLISGILLISVGILSFFLS